MQKKIIRIAAVLCLLCPWAVRGGFAPAVRAEEISYEQTDVLDDLSGAVIGGKPFDITDYPFDERGKPQIVAFAEYGYSFYADNQGDYGLYVYVYNPRGQAIDTDTDRNKISLTYGGRENWMKYGLEFLDYSSEAGYEGLFYKFRVDIAENRAEMLDALVQSERIYGISELELSVKNTVTAYPCMQTYTYSGYAEGYGPELSEGSTLACRTDGFEKYLTLDVRPTYYRPEGTNGEAYARDTLHSVYFSVPDEILEEYGKMTAVHATWRNAKTNPVFVTGNKEVYESVLPYVGKAVDGGQFTYAKDDVSPVPYSLIASKYIESASWNGVAPTLSYMSYNANRSYTNSDKEVTTLYYCFLAENGDADNYTLPAEKLTGEGGYFESYTKEHGGELVNARYSRDLFEETADGFTDITISESDTFELTDEVISQNLWQQFVGGGYDVSGTNTYTVSAIRQVEDGDLSGDKTEVCEKLYIDESDYAEFERYCEEAEKREETVYLFRYCQSEYLCYEVAEYLRGEGGQGLAGKNFGYDFVDTNAYFMQMWVQLDFDIIDLTFTKDDVDTVIPAVMSPTDIAADGSPSVITNGDDDFDWKTLLGIILGAILLIVVLPLIATLAPYLVKGIVWVLLLPVKGIAAIIDSLKKRRNK